MASRTVGRRALREQNDQAEAAEAVAEPTVKKARVRKVAAEKPAKVRVAATPRVRTRKVKAPPRMVARWAVCDAALKRVAMFEYKDRAGADSKLSEMQDLKKGTYVLQLVKELYEPPAAAEVEAVVAV
ncbi:hypothetical protein [Gemmata sp.]|uniref:hypothetical protein n=1 Tax=Gemmata sp. TaxID=1914242 RepID=UPI003F6E96C6